MNVPGSLYFSAVAVYSCQLFLSIGIAFSGLVTGAGRFPDASALLSFTAGRYGFMPEEEMRPTALSFVGYNCDEEEVLTGLKDCLVP